MSGLRLRTVTRTQGNNADLKNGAVTPAGFTFDFEEVPVLVQGFRRMVREVAYDVCEMAITTYLCAKAQGKPFTALPIFLVRDLHHGAIWCNRTAGIEHPTDLHGARVGVNRGYTVTTGVWARGILSEEHGVDLDRVTWVPSDEEHVSEYRPPSNVEALPAGTDLVEQLVTGALPAAVGGLKVDHPDVRPLLADPEAAAYAALEERGLYPINHLIVVRDELLDRHPDLAAAVFDAFATSKRRYVGRLRHGDLADASPVDRMHRRVLDITGEDPLPYGVAPNRSMLDLLLRHAVEQHILERPLDVPDMFAAGTEDLVG